MRIGFCYGERVAVLPAAITAHLHKASKKDITILLELAAEPLAQVDLSAATASITARAGYTPEEIAGAIAFWRGAGVLCMDEGDESVHAVNTMPAQRESTIVPRVIADKGLPRYSAEELASILERRTELSQLINDCQQAFGKIFSTSEVGIVVGLADFLGLDAEYILLLLTHCRNMEKKSLRYVEKMAHSLYDEGVHDAKNLEERLHKIELMAGKIGHVRAIFGIGTRALTSKEKKMVERWIFEMKYDEALLTRAYEITVDSTTNPSIPYANSILERWYAAGYRTIDDVDKALADYKRKKSGGSSFDVDEFFEAGLRRSYKE